MESVGQQRLWRRRTVRVRLRWRPLSPHSAKDAQVQGLWRPPLRLHKPWSSRLRPHEMKPQEMHSLRRYPPSPPLHHRLVVSQKQVSLTLKLYRVGASKSGTLVWGWGGRQVSVGALGLSRSV